MSKNSPKKSVPRRTPRRRKPAIHSIAEGKDAARFPNPDKPPFTLEAHPDDPPGFDLQRLIPFKAKIKRKRRSVEGQLSVGQVHSNPFGAHIDVRVYIYRWNGKTLTKPPTQEELAKFTVDLLEHLRTSAATSQ